VHLPWRISVQTDERGGPGQEAGGRLGKRGRNTVHARHRNAHRIRIDGREGLHVGRQVADFVIILRFGQRAYFLKPELRAAVDESGMDRQPLAIEGAFDVAGNPNVGANGGN
jgi:hypothetical protein